MYEDAHLLLKMSIFFRFFQHERRYQKIQVEKNKKHLLNIDTDSDKKIDTDPVKHTVLHQRIRLWMFFLQFTLFCIKRMLLFSVKLCKLISLKLIENLHHQENIYNMIPVSTHFKRRIFVQYSLQLVENSE